MVVFRIVSILLGYLFGLFPTGVLYGKAHNVDIRSKGSGNSGMTNSLRVLGWKAGVVVFFGDCLKAVAAMAIIWGVARTRYPDAVKLLELYAGFGAVLGHNFPFYMKFKGGKGIAVLAGLIISTSWWMTIIELIIFVTIVALTRYISLGSLFVSMLFLMLVMVNGQLGGFGVAQSCLNEMYVLAAFLMVLAWIRHRANIGRLLKGEENKFGNPNKTKR